MLYLIFRHNETVEKVHFETNLQIFKKVFFSTQVKKQSIAALELQQPSVCMLSIINLVFLFLFGVEPLAKYFSKKILFRQAQRLASSENKAERSGVLFFRCKRLLAALPMLW